jgi:hypothetical protein
MTHHLRHSWIEWSRSGPVLLLGYWERNREERRSGSDEAWERRRRPAEEVSRLKDGLRRVV